MSPSSTVPQFEALVREHGSDFIMHRDVGAVECPCRTEEGFRDPEFHLRWKGLISSVTGTNVGVPGDATAMGPAQNVTGVDYLVFMGNGAGIVGPPAMGGLFLGATQYGAVYIHGRQEILDLGVTAVVFRRLTLGGVQQAWQNLGVQPLYLPGGWYDNVPLNFTNARDPELIGTCNPEGLIPAATTEIGAKGFIQPIQSGAVRRLTGEQIAQMFGEIQTDDHIGIIPVSWGGQPLEFFDWPQSMKDFIIYNGRRFTVVSTNLIPDPADGNPAHHWELGLRLISG